MAVKVSSTVATGLTTSNERHHRGRRVLRVVALIGVVTLVASQLRPGEVWAAFSRITLLHLVFVVLVLTPLAVLLRALRWRSLLGDGQRLPLHSYAAAYVIGVLANSLLLGRFGDLVKARAICDSHIDYARSVAVVVIDRLLEGLALVLLFVAVLLASPMPVWAHQLAWIAGVGSAAILLALSAMFVHRRALLPWVERALTHCPKRLRGRALLLTQRAIAGCEALASSRRVFSALLYALAVWIVEIITVGSFLVAFAVPAPLVVSAIVLLAVLNFGMLVPVSPGSLGVYQVLCAVALSLWGVDRQLALGMGIVMQTVLFLPLYLGGVIGILVRSWSRKTQATPPIPVRPDAVTVVDRI